MLKNNKNKNTVTNIHHYNQFLANLDKQACEAKSNLLKIDEKKNIDDYDSLEQAIKKLCKLFDDYNYESSMFNGSNKEDEKEYHDPNLYDYKKNNFYPRKSSKKTQVTIDAEINTINDLLTLINTYPVDENTEYNINMKSLHDIKDSLTDLNNMVGMKNLKNNIVNQILYFIQGLHKNKNNSNSTGGDFMHTVLYGPPGTGKTEIAKIIGKIYSKMGILKKGIFKKVTRSDLVAGYLGQTAIKTRDVIKECIGGVLFIDEAYALGNNEKKDSFSKECIDTLCEALSDHKHELMVIIAGYENELNECFFNYNQGLDSRFTWRFNTDKYNGEELYQIFIKKIKDNDWSIDEKSLENASWFQQKIDSFPSYGRDIETLFTKIKITHSKRVFCKPEIEKKRINKTDLEKGFELYNQNDNIKTRTEKEKFNQMLINTMYL
jgi:SpoVK/Ycf46/Vps4 family AAA+-type ATPase